MEGAIKLLVALALVTGFLWVVSPIISILVSGSMMKPPDLKISDFTYNVVGLPECDCMKNMCEITGGGTLYNFGGDSKEIILTVFFNDMEGRNIGSLNLPVISKLGYQNTFDFSFATNFSCAATAVTASVIHSESD